MKKTFLFIAGGLIAVTLITSLIGSGFFSAGKKVVKTDSLSLILFKGSDYTQAAFDSTKAQVHVFIKRINSDGLDKIVWDELFGSKALSQYAPAQDAVKQEVEFSEPSAKNEYLVLEYDIDYNSNGSELKIENDVFLNRDSSKIVSINI